MATRVTRSKREQSQQQEQQNRARWTSYLTKILADLMVEQVYKGNRQNNSFGKKSWKYMCDDFYRKTGLKWDKEQLKNRYAVLRRQYAAVKTLLDRGDFTWDESTGTIIASEKAWTEIIREHPDVEPLKASGCSIYKKLCTIFSESATNNGKHDQSAELGERTRSNIGQTTPLCLQQESSSESEETDDVVEIQDTGQPSTPRTGVRKRGRKGIDDAIAEAIFEMAAASKMRTTAIQQCNATKYSVTKCIKLLDEMQGVDEKLYLAALDMFNKPSSRETFMSLTGDKRLTWLRCKVHGAAHLP
ncbi:L10-interacting MYB domain-containing protein-like [Humulus lupulus]|uniref:L10-interacting MYB domain-containing protein-like n=1 Tax=Humulus lupulus TaxID=3486 RepID=UPI002B40C0D9|nr:L10-interacting MYB domain-containing protein-like [Humulus lupulus]XP_062102681.1 L10-interacting MYB domain-containing protein-like [Humulus lupulus]XP_062102682.1 L10-interacting MYB domain-containing protein-like [Humulus lupulus]